MFSAQKPQNKKAAAFPPQKQPVVQRFYMNEGKCESSFDRNIVLNPNDNAAGDGGALTIGVSKQSNHASVILEWYDGAFTHDGKTLAVDLNVPDLAALNSQARQEKREGFWGHVKSAYHTGKGQAKSFLSAIPFDFTAIPCSPQRRPGFDPNLYAGGNSRFQTVRLTEAAKETKRQFLEGEIGKQYKYHLGTFDCWTWAEYAAPEVGFDWGFWRQDLAYSADDTASQYAVPAPAAPHPA